MVAQPERVKCNTVAFVAEHPDVSLADIESAICPTDQNRAERTRMQKKYVLNMQGMLTQYEYKQRPLFEARYNKKKLCCRKALQRLRQSYKDKVISLEEYRKELEALLCETPLYSTPRVHVIREILKTFYMV